MEEMILGFDNLLEGQYELQLKAYGVDPLALEDDEWADFIRWNAYALSDELHEATSELGWKPWATSRHINREAFIGEMVDLLHFFANLCLAAGVDGSDLAKAYASKREKNHQRQEEGYTGTYKCPGCKRDYDESDCSPGETITDGMGRVIKHVEAWCKDKGVIYI